MGYISIKLICRYLTLNLNNKPLKNISSNTYEVTCVLVMSTVFYFTMSATDEQQYISVPIRKMVLSCPDCVHALTCA